MSPDAVEALMQKVHTLELKARRLSKENFAGNYHASFKGQGLDFEDFREYIHGDEPRFIDWNVTARMNTPFIRTFKEERELSIILAIDISGSSAFGSNQTSKREFAAEIAAVLAFTARIHGNKVGLLLFANDREYFLAPEKGSKHILRIVREILATVPKDPKTNISAACKFLNKTIKKKSMVFMISDFMSYEFDKDLGALSRQHDLIAIRVSDPSEVELPKAGNVLLTDPETGEQRAVNTNNPNVRTGYEKLYQRHFEGVKSIFTRYQIDHCQVSTCSDYLPPLHRLFKTRSSRHA